jgi:ribonuclease E
VVLREPREPRTRSRSGATSADEDGVRGITGSTRMAAKRVRRQEGRDSGRGRKPILSEAEFLARARPSTAR